MIANTFTDDDIVIFQNSKPFNFIYKDDFLITDFATRLQSEILQISDDKWDLYNNPFENKLTLRDKWNLPPLVSILFRELESQNFIQQLEKLSGKKLYRDDSRNFWGIHKFKNGDHLDIHLDAEVHPATEQKKQLTLGIYMTTQNWTVGNGGNIELWEGDSTSIKECKVSLEPLFNRMILFDNSDNSWHGSPNPISCDDDKHRIFVTLSYMSHSTPLNVYYKNNRKKAYFVSRPQDNWNQDKLILRDLRCDPDRCQEIYRTI